MDLKGWGRPLPASNLGELPFYPPFSHWLAAGVGKLLGSGPIGMTVVASASVGLFYLAMFVMSFRIDWRVPIFASLSTICYALLRGPVFGRSDRADLRLTLRSDLGDLPAVGVRRLEGDDIGHGMLQRKSRPETGRLVSMYFWLCLTAQIGFTPSGRVDRLRPGLGNSIRDIFNF
jgi:hypothetical protein